MYLDSATLLAICIALVSQMIMMIVLLRSAHRWEQAYRNLHRIVKIERAARK